MRRVFPTTLRHGRLSLHIVPILVWLVVLAAVGSLFLHRAERCEVMGLAIGETYDVTATCNGRLKSLPVKLFDHVQPGTTLAVINTVLDNENLQSSLEARKATIEAEIARLKAALNAAEEQLNVQLADRKDQREAAYRRLSLDVEQARLAALELKAVLEPDKIMLKDLELEVRIVKDLFARNAVEQYELDKVETEYKVLAKKIETNGDLLEQARKDADTTVERLTAMENKKPVDPSLGLTLNPIRAAINVQYKMIDELLLDLAMQRMALPLMAPFAGVVSSIQRRAGEAVLSGEPILTIARPIPDTVMGWIPQEEMEYIRQGRKVRLVKYGANQQIAMSEITVVGPTIETIPQRLWRLPNLPEYGLPFQVGIPPGLRLTPQEKVGIKLL